jgi:hypothetical chaperone protein
MSARASRVGDGFGSRIGIDFGTSSSSLAIVADDGHVQFAQLSTLGVLGPSWRTLLFFDPDEQQVHLPIQYYAGGDAIAAYLESMGEGRLVQSFKSHLTTEALGRTQIGHLPVSLDDMIALFLLRLRQRAEAFFGCTIDAATIGRPVRFVGSRTPDEDDAAAARLLAAAKLAGFTDARLELEPVAAAHHYERRLTRPELALVADFGAGTTDFCLMRVGPTGTGGERMRDIVGTGGVGAAGDDLDAALIENLVCPSLGKGDTYVEMGAEHPIPGSYFYKLARWHHLSFLAGTRVRSELERLHRFARHPERIAALMHIVSSNQAFHLHKSVERVKVELSAHETATFHYADGPVDIRTDVSRSDFERWIAPVTEAITTCLDDTMTRAGVGPHDVDCVFMTGGTAFVPIVRRAFEARFGAQKLRSGDELLSIASGLAMRSLLPR